VNGELSIGRHGVIGDRRTAALVGADGALVWLCLPDYDDAPVFGGLLDGERGGAWHFGPEGGALGRQRYRDDSAVLATSWEGDGFALELTDAMAWPWDDRGPADGGGDARAVIRRLHCLRGEAPCRLRVEARDDFDRPAAVARRPGGASLRLGPTGLDLWTTQPPAIVDGLVEAAFTLRAGEEAWAVLATGACGEWSAARAGDELARTERYWRGWSAGLAYDGPRRDQVCRSALTIHLLSFAPTGSPVAAPTTSLPERIGGDRNWDYRYAWVRDASLSLGILSRLGETAVAQRYMDCLTTYPSTTESPLQVVYGVNGRTDLPERERHDLAGYRGSRPVRYGNRACGQRQLDSLGFFVDCALVYHEAGGPWRERYWDTVRRAAAYTVGHWRQPDSGIWEAREEAHFVSSKVMSWVALDRAVRLAERLARDGPEIDEWRRAMATIHADVLERGWSERRGAFVQRYGAEALDASALLIPVMGFLPADDPRCLATAELIAAELAIDGLVHRWNPREAPGDEDRAWAVGEFEGAFLPCSFWLATTWLRVGRRAEASAILARAERSAGELGLFAEEIDAGSGAFLGNYPLLFAHAEYLRTALEQGGSAEGPNDVSRRDPAPARS